jgi:hypothetical protein
LEHDLRVNIILSTKMPVFMANVNTAWPHSWIAVPSTFSHWRVETRLKQSCGVRGEGEQSGQLHTKQNFGKACNSYCCLGYEYTQTHTQSKVYAKFRQSFHVITVKSGYFWSREEMWRKTYASKVVGLKLHWPL